MMLAPVFWLVAVVLAALQFFIGHNVLLTLCAFAFWGMGAVSLVYKMRQAIYEEK